jgi:HSP20 family protein
MVAGSIAGPSLQNSHCSMGRTTMSVERTNQQREDTTTRDTSRTSRGPTDTATRTAPTAERGDQERALETGREAAPSTAPARRPQTGMGNGAGRGQVSPFSLMRRMADDMDRLFENFGFGRMGLGSTLATDFDRDLWRGSSALDQTAAWAPEVETFRRGDKLVVRADLPGLKKDDVKVEIDNGVLAISGERHEEHEENRDDYYRSERSYGQFYRAIPLPEGVSEDQCEASFKDGVLEVSLQAPKEESRRTKQIPVK